MQVFSVAMGNLRKNSVKGVGTGTECAEQLSQFENGVGVSQLSVQCEARVDGARNEIVAERFAANRTRVLIAEGIALDAVRVRRQFNRDLGTLPERVPQLLQPGWLIAAENVIQRSCDMGMRWRKPPPLRQVERQGWSRHDRDREVMQ